MKHPVFDFLLNAPISAAALMSLWQIVPHLLSVDTEGSVGKCLALSKSARHCSNLSDVLVIFSLQSVGLLFQP